MKQSISLPTWLLLPSSALSLAALIIGWLDLLGFHAQQWLQIVHGIITKWNYWHGVAFHWVDIALPIELDLDKSERNLVIVYLFAIPLFVQATVFLVKRFGWLFIAITILTVIGIGFLIGYLIGEFTHDAIQTSNTNTVAAVLVLLCSLFMLRSLRRRYFNALMFFLFFIASLEFIRLIPNFQPQVDAFHQWIDATPADYIKDM